MPGDAVAGSAVTAGGAGGAVHAVEEGAAYLYGLHTSNGMPLLSRSVGGLTPLNSAAQGTLYGVSVYFDKKGAQLHSTTTSTASLVWRSFNDRIMLVLICDKRHDRGYDIAFSCYVGGHLMPCSPGLLSDLTCR
jgi:hypothetical protein